MHNLSQTPTILLACLTSKPLFLKHSFMVSIYLLAILSHSILSIWPNHRSTPSSLIFTPHNSLIYAFGTQSILLIPSNPLWLSIFADVENLTTSVYAGLSKRQRFHTFNTHDTKPRATQRNALHFGTGSRSIPTRCYLLISFRRTYNDVCCMSEKKVSSYKLHMTPFYDMN